MERMSCPTRGCGAVYPDYARFCPRCGNANPRVMSVFDRSRPPHVECKPVERPAWRRSSARGAFRFVGLLFIIPWLMFGHHHSTWHGASAQVSSDNDAHVPSWYRSSVDDGAANRVPVSLPAPVADVSTLTAFQTQLAIGFTSDQARSQWRQQITGQHVHWTGYVFTPRDGIGSPALASGIGVGSPLIHIQTATREAKNKFREIPEGSKVQVDGVLLDDHWLHVIDVSRTR